MLAIRMQRTGRSGHAQFRVVVQDSRFSPTSGRVVSYLGYYNPHTKDTNLDKDKAATYLANGAQPSPRVVKLLKKEGVELPAWVKEPAQKQKDVRNPDKRRSTRAEQPAGATAEAPSSEPPEATEAEAEASTAEPVTEAEAPTETVEETPAPAEAENPTAEEAQPAELEADNAEAEEPASDKPAVEKTDQ